MPPGFQACEPGAEPRACRADCPQVSVSAIRGPCTRFRYRGTSPAMRLPGAVRLLSFVYSGVSTFRHRPLCLDMHKRSGPASSGPCFPSGEGHPIVPRTRTAGSVPRPHSQDKRRETGKPGEGNKVSRTMGKERSWQRRCESPEFRPFSAAFDNPLHSGRGR